MFDLVFLYLSQCLILFSAIGLIIVQIVIVLCWSLQYYNLNQLDLIHLVKLQTLQSKKDGAGIFLMFSFYLEMVEKMRQAAIAFFIDVFMSKMTLTLKITLNFYGKFGTLQLKLNNC